MELLEKKPRPYFTVLLVSIFCITIGFCGLWAYDAAYADSIPDRPFISPLGSHPVTPTPDNLYMKIASVRTTDSYPPNELFPKSLSSLNDPALKVTAEAYAVMDRDTGELLLAKNLTKQMSIASVTKVMTTILALEKVPLDQLVTVSAHAASVGEATMGLTAKERLTIEELLYGAMLPSGNDAAETLAEGTGKYLRKIPLSETDGGGSRKTFLDEMNKKAQSLGMMDTYFFNPTGLDEEDPEHSTFSTCLDLLALGKYALQNKQFSDIANTRVMHFPYKEGYHKDLYVQNILSLSDSYEGIKGIKPGNSDYAKETLLSYIERDGRRIIAVVLGSDQTKDDILEIYRYIFEK